MKVLKLCTLVCFTLLNMHLSATAQDTQLSSEEQQALDKAKNLRQELSEGAEFTELAKKYSDDPGSASLGGELGFMQKGQLVPQYEEAVLAMKVGGITEPVRSEFGYHIIQLLAIREGSFNSRHILIKP